MRLISIFCHYILIVICINYLIESRSIQLLEKRGTYRELRYVNKEHELSNDFLNNRQLYKYPNHFFYIIHNFFSVSFHFNPDFKISFYNDISNIYLLNLGFITSNNVVNDGCHKKVSFFYDNYNQMAGVQQEKTLSNKSYTYDSEGNNMNYNNNCLYFILLLLLYLFRNTFPKNRKLLWLFFIFSSLVPFYFRIFFPNDFQESFHNKLKKCQNVNFFSIESIKV